MDKSVYLPLSAKQSDIDETLKGFFKAKSFHVHQSKKSIYMQKGLWEELDVIFPPSIIQKETFLKFIKKTVPGFLTKKLKKALKIAEDCHKNQKRRNGLPYLEGHVLPVALYALLVDYKYYNNPNKNVVIASLLHDVVEDCREVALRRGDKGSYEFSLDEYFNNKVVNYVDLLTKRPYEYYEKIAKKKNTLKEGERVQDLRDRLYVKRLLSGPIEAVNIKCSDRILNLINDIEFHPEQNLDKVKKYKKETEKHYLPLFNKRGGVYKETVYYILNIIENKVYENNTNCI